MNFAFIIDNCLQTCQLTYNGVSLLDYAKNATEFFVKKRIKYPDAKYDTYHLFSSNQTHSSWLHDVNHLLQQLKTIQPCFENMINFEEPFSTLNKFRTLYGADNVYGGRDIYKIESSIIILFISRDFEMIIDKIPFRWDYKLVVFYLAPPGPEEGEILEPIQTKWIQYAEQLGYGKCYIVQSYHQLFEYIDELTMAQPQVCLKLTTLNTEFKYEEMQKYIEKIPNKENTSWLVKSQQKVFFQFACQRFKQNPNKTIHTKVYLPEVYPLNDLDKFPSFPEYYIDFTSLYIGKIPLHMPHQEVVFESTQLLQFIQGLPIKRQFYMFPIIYMDMYTNFVAGYLYYTTDKQQMELRFLFPNFVTFSDIYSNIQQTFRNSNRGIDMRLQNYLSQVPNYYSPCIKKFFSDLNIQLMVQKQFQFCLDDQNHQNYMVKVRQFEMNKQRQKKILDEESYKLRQAHQQKKSTCCAAQSQDFNAVFKEQMDTEYYWSAYDTDPYEFKVVISQKSQSCCIPFIAQHQFDQRNPKLDQDEPEVRLEPAFCGNPWKLYKRTYRDSIEIRNENEEDQQVDMINMQQYQEKNLKNKRKGFIRQRDLIKSRQSTLTVQAYVQQKESNEDEMVIFHCNKKYTSRTQRQNVFICLAEFDENYDSDFDIK
ncbi:Integrator complex subunit 6 [Paramecium bursaria]